MFNFGLNETKNQKVNENLKFVFAQLSLTHWRKLVAHRFTSTGGHCICVYIQEATCERMIRGGIRK